MSTYQIALDIAKRAHAGQIRWDGSDYFPHVETVGINVYNSLKNRGLISEAILALNVGILHDAGEDHPEYWPEIESAGFTDEEIKCLHLLNRNKDVSYVDYLIPIRENLIAREVKKADLRHNISCFPDNKNSYQRAKINLYKLALFMLEEYKD